MHTIASSIANVVTGRQPLASILATDTCHIRPADNLVDPFTEDMSVAGSPVWQYSVKIECLRSPLLARLGVSRRFTGQTTRMNPSFLFAAHLTGLRL